jgi:hypothetical protein
VTRQRVRSRLLGSVSFVIAATAFGVVAGCSTSERSEDLAVGLIEDAIEAVEVHFASVPTFYEINATSDGVNLFVSVNGSDGSPAVVQARYTASNGLVVSDEAVAADGAVFARSAVDFDAETVLDVALDQLGSSQPRVFIITAAGVSDEAQSVSDRVDYRLVMESERGGRLVVLLSRDGSILGSDVID